MRASGVAVKGHLRLPCGRWLGSVQMLAVLIEEAVRQVVLREMRRCRETLATHRHRVWAARAEAAAARWMDQARQLATRSGRRAQASDAVGIGSRLEKELGIWMTGPLRHLFAWAALNHLPGVHDQRLVREVARAGDVVGDVEYRDAILFFEAKEQIEHLQANRDVQHRDWLVCQQDRPLPGERAGKGHPPALAAGELVRVPAHHSVLRGQTDP